ncbi:MAG: fasciclin domain-containing protein, partial [Pseudomonadota bacterium]|nr:fasciclin domain-containing protein [Pseudomonadota bacterium]
VVNGVLTLNGKAEVTAADVGACNGVIHVIDAVLIPPSLRPSPSPPPLASPSPPQCSPLIATATAAGTFTTLLSALAATGLSATLAGDGPFTVFAPTDAAFAALPEGTLDGLTQEELAQVLLYHVVSGSVEAATAVTLDSAGAASGERIDLSVVNGVLTLNGKAEVTAADVGACNGVIHVIDAVLQPTPWSRCSEAE